MLFSQKKASNLLLIWIDSRQIMYIFKYWKRKIFIFCAYIVAIQKLPEYLINRLKAWEVVEKPASVIKELVENSLDAWATSLIIDIHDGGKSIIQIQDNGSGIELSDMDLVLERYATSKIKEEQDLRNIQSYGFRWEALASIAEVSKISILSKTAYAEIATKLTKRGTEIMLKHQPSWFNHGTLITIEDLFYNVPARLKFLKSTQTEYYYCYQHIIDTAICHPDKDFTLKKNDKIVFNLEGNSPLSERITQIFKKDLSAQTIKLNYENDRMQCHGIIWDSKLRFGSKENIKIYVNQRPVQDKIIYRSLMDAYKRQITPWEFPLAILFLNIPPTQVDVNAHPQKSEVRFTNPNDIYQIIYNTITEHLSTHKIAHFSKNIHQIAEGFDYVHDTKTIPRNIPTIPIPQSSPMFTPTFRKGHLSQHQDFSDILSQITNEQTPIQNDTLWEYQIIWQLRNSYIILQNNDAIYYIDQHALAERINFEEMKKKLANTKDEKQASENLLQPIAVAITTQKDINTQIEKLKQNGFDCELIWERRIIVYAIPQIFIQHKIDLEILFNQVIDLEKINFDHIIDRIFATKACKWSIKSWQKLSQEQMQNLIQEWFEKIPWMFVCQHGRPFFIKIPKDQIDKMFDR